MATSAGHELAQNIRGQIEELKKVGRDLDEDTASRAPEGRWSPKEILSHLLGPEGAEHLSMLQPVLDRDVPKIDIEPEVTFFSEERSRKTFAQLLSEVEREYNEISEFAEGLSPEQLDRKAQIPLLKDTPLGEYPTLGTWIGILAGFGESHLRFHINHMREVLRDLGRSA